MLFRSIDDNFVADHKHAIEICKAIAPLNIKWVTQGAITIAKNDELLYWMKKSGCKMILIGYESMNPNILKDMGKGWRSGVGEINELTEKIHSYGIGIYATFVFGYGNDTKETFDETVKFAKKHGFYFAAFNHGGGLHRRFAHNGRAHPAAKIGRASCRERV